ncbi:MAG: dehydrogenase [Bacteroidetes bacterium]|nr:MAG: dehydrogenase [Bacteroidota bacterium]
MKKAQHDSKQLDKQRFNAAVVGFGLSGKVFHTPYIQQHPGFELYSIVSKGNEAQKKYPKTIVFPHYEDVINDPAIDLVVLCTPHNLHVSQAIEAMQAGKDVVIEKPVALTSSDILLLIEESKKTKRQFFPYHNRRWDGDFLTVKQLIRDGYLGSVHDYESRFDRFSPSVSRAEWRYSDHSAGGTLFDLGPHLIDQAIHLFGKPDMVHCLLFRQRPESKSNDGFDLRLLYPNRVVTLKAGVFVKSPGPRFLIHGTEGSFIKYGLDVQESRLKRGVLPDSKIIGKEPANMHGILLSPHYDPSEAKKFPTLNGNYMKFYDGVYEALKHKTPHEVSQEDALLVIKVIEAAVKSNENQQHIQL